MPPLGHDQHAGLTESERWSIDRLDPATMTGMDAGRLLALRRRATRDEAAVIDALLAKIPARENAPQSGVDDATRAAAQRIVDTSASMSMQEGREAGRNAAVITSRFDDALVAARADRRISAKPSDSPSPFDAMHVVGADRSPYDGDAA